MKRKKHRLRHGQWPQHAIAEGQAGGFFGWVRLAGWLAGWLGWLAGLFSWRRATPKLRALAATADLADLIFSVFLFLVKAPKGQALICRSFGQGKPGGPLLGEEPLPLTRFGFLLAQHQQVFRLQVLFPRIHCFGLTGKRGKTLLGLCVRAKIDSWRPLEPVELLSNCLRGFHNKSVRSLRVDITKTKAIHASISTR